MNICVIMSTSFPPEEGIGNYVYNMSKKFIEKGHQVTVITRGSLKMTSKFLYNRIRVIKAPFLPVYPFHVHIHSISVNKLLKSLEPDLDLVHVHTPLSPMPQTSLPIITTVHTPIKTGTRFVEFLGPYSLAVKIMARFISYPLELKLLRNSDMITTVSRSVVEGLWEYKLDPTEIVVIGNGVDENIFIPAQQKKEGKYILYVGRLSYRKGLFDLIECGRYICQEYPDISFILTGKGPLLDKLQKKVREMGLSERFKFVGYVDKDRLIQLYQNAMIFVLPSHYEGLPTVLLEAMSCGLPVVATAVSGNTEVISSGENGILIPPNSPKEMSTAISKILNDSYPKKRLGRNARMTIETQYTWDAIAHRMLECYESLLRC